MVACQSTRRSTPGSTWNDPRASRSEPHPRRRRRAVVGGPAGRVIGVEPQAITDLDTLKLAFQAELDIDPAMIDEKLNAPGVQPDHFVTITTVDVPTYNLVEPVIYPLPGTRFRDTFLRGGPTPEFAAHVLGRFGEITAERLEELGEPYQAGDLVGLTGLEAAYEEQLAGTPSSTVRVVGADDEVVDEVERFEARTRAAPHHHRSRGADRRRGGAGRYHHAARRGGRRRQEQRPSCRPATARRVQLGHQRRVPARLDVQDRHHQRPAGRRCHARHHRRVRAHRQRQARVQNFESSSLGNVPFGLAFAQSCNTAFISTSADVADADLVAAAENFGFNTDYSIGLDTATGSFPTPADPTEHAAAVIGQGKVTASPLHMATVGATVLDGTWEPPVLLPERDADDAPTATSLAAGASRHALRAHAPGRHRGQWPGGRWPGAEVAGKTGTAEYDAGDPPPPMPGSWGCGASCRWRCWSRTASRAARSPRPSLGASSPACPGEGASRACRFHDRADARGPRRDHRRQAGPPVHRQRRRQPAGEHRVGGPRRRRDRERAPRHAPEAAQRAGANRGWCCPSRAGTATPWAWTSTWSSEAPPG